MSTANLEQIFHWLEESFGPLLKQYTIPLAAIWATVAVIYIIFKIKRLFRTKAEPDITYAQIKIEPFDLPSFRYIQGSFIATNSGRQSCNVTKVRVLHENLDFEIIDISDEVRDQINPRDRGKIGVQLPLQIKGNKTSKIFFNGSHKIETLEELPEKLSLEVTFDCKKEPFICLITREPGKKTYMP